MTQNYAVDVRSPNGFNMNLHVRDLVISGAQEGDATQSRIRGGVG